jgi:hypothetical protein
MNPAEAGLKGLSSILTKSEGGRFDLKVACINVTTDRIAKTIPVFPS